MRVKHTHAIHAYMFDLLQSQFFSLFYPIAATTTSFLRSVKFTCSLLRDCVIDGEKSFILQLYTCFEEGGGTLLIIYMLNIWQWVSSPAAFNESDPKGHTWNLPSLKNSSLMMVIYLYMLLHTRYEILMTVSDMKNLRNKKQFVRSSAWTLLLKNVLYFKAHLLSMFNNDYNW